MPTPGFALFDTAIGRCGVAWGERGITRVQLPEKRESETRIRLRRLAVAASETKPPREVQRAIARITALLRGERIDLSDIALDLGPLPPFQRRVYQAARSIAPGETRSYGELAATIGSPGAARAVGQALSCNPFAIVVPCHRVLSAGRKPGGFTASGGVRTKLRMLAIEGAAPDRARVPAANRAELAFDPRKAVKHLRASDPALARVIDAAGPFSIELQATSSVFAALAEAIVHQQLSNQAAATIYGRIRGLYRNGGAGPTPRQILRTPDAKLRGAGLSAAKLLALRDLAERTERRELPTLAKMRGLPDTEIIERLTRVRGIGRWTAEMFLIFRLGRPDVLPADDLGVRAGFRAAFRKRALPGKRELELRGERWRPYRSVASWYLWRAAERAKRPAVSDG
jgi:methylated-DNA-[protein]-cysteine S-methyltransferase